MEPEKKRVRKTDENGEENKSAGDRPMRLKIGRRKE